MSALVLTVSLVAGQSGLCAGWMATPEARMACCVDGGSCPMHESESADDNSTRVVTQADADRCCAAAEPDQSSPSPSGAAFVVTLAIVVSPVPAFLPALERHAEVWRASAPEPAPHTPKHVLLSVFLV